MNLTVGSLFSGIGGLDLGLEMTDHFEVIWQSEIDPYASKVLKKHWPTVPNLGDITKINYDNIETPALICGGFPCQDISVAGKGVGINGQRSGLWKEMYRAICSLRPRYVLVENVAMLTKRGLGVVLGDLAKGGYDAEWNIVSASSVGAHHKRERLFIFAYDQENSSCPNSINSGSHSSEIDLSRDNELRNQQMRRSWTMGSEIPEHNRGGIWKVDPTDTQPEMGRVVDGVPSFVDRLRGLGNAVVPQVGQFLGELIWGFHNDQMS